MKYIIDSDELEKLIGDLLWSGKYDKMKIKSLVNKFLKSKQPVELVAEGKIGKVIMDLYLVYMHNEGYKRLNKMYKGNTKIYIEKVREDISNQPPNPIPCKNIDCYDKEGNIIKGDKLNVEGKEGEDE